MQAILTPPPLLASPVSAWDPRWKLATLLFMAVVTALFRTVPAACAGLVLALVLIEAARLPRPWYLGRILGIAVLLLIFVVWLPFLPNAGPVWTIGPVTIYQQGLGAAVLVLVKAMTIVALMLLLWATTPVEVSLKAAHALRIPSILVQVLFLTYRYLFLLADEFARLRIALRTRGFRNRGDLHSYRTVGHVSGILLVRSHERAERVAAAMRCRGFDGQFRCLTDFRTRPADVAASIVLAASIMAVLVWDLLAR